MDRGAWQATVHGVAKSQTWHNTFTFKIYGIEHLFIWLFGYVWYIFVPWLLTYMYLFIIIDFILIFLPALGLLAACELSLLAVSEGYSLVAEAFHCSDFSCCWAWAVEYVGFSSCDAWMPCCMWNLPQPGIKPVSSLLAGRLLTTGPPGKSLLSF